VDEREITVRYGADSPKRSPEPVEKIDPEADEIQIGFGDSPCGELNTVALRNLSAWVGRVSPISRSPVPSKTPLSPPTINTNPVIFFPVIFSLLFFPLFPVNAD
jgi:hypothetical protein